MVQLSVTAQSAFSAPRASCCRRRRHAHSHLRVVAACCLSDIKLPFGKTVEITASLAPRSAEPGAPAAPPAHGACVQLYCIVRGHETSAAAPAIVLPSGLALPPTARMQLQATDGTTTHNPPMGCPLDLRASAWLA